MSKMLPIALIVLSCCGGAQYRRQAPAPEAHDLTIALTTGLPPASGTVDTGPQGVRTVSEVTLTARVGAWNGGEAICRRVTPVGMAIDNRGDQPLRIRYDTFELETDKGERFSALPPFEMRFPAGRAPMALKRRGQVPLQLRQAGFAVAAAYQHIFPALPSFPGHACAPSAYYRAHASYWRRLGPPSREMLRRALPEGVLQSGGRASGFVYFEKVPPETKVLTLSYELEDPLADMQFGYLAMTLVPPPEVLVPTEAGGELDEAPPAKRRRRAPARHRRRSRR